MFGGAAKHAYRCRGREFTGNFDDCFNDYLPIAELAAPIIAIGTAYWFFRYSRSLFDGASSAQPKRYSFEDGLPAKLIFALGGTTWSLWRACKYQLVPELIPFTTFWMLFA